MNYNIPDVLVEAYQESDIVIGEGFEKVGKSTLLKVIRTLADVHTINYRPDWEGSMSDKLISRGNRFIPGLSVIEFWSSAKYYIKGDAVVALDRSLPTNYVYWNIFNQSTDAESIEELVASYHKNFGSMKVLIIHKTHKDKETAKRMFDITSSDHDDQYDNYKDFEHYYEVFQMAESFFNEFYEKHLGSLRLIKLDSITNEVLYDSKGVE